MALVAALGFGLPSAVSAADTAVVQVDLNLRTGPGLDYDVIQVTPVGSSVTLTGASVDGWYSVIYDRTAGWAFGELLAPGDEPGMVPAPSASPGFITESVAGRRVAGCSRH